MTDSNQSFSDSSSSSEGGLFHSVPKELAQLSRWDGNLRDYWSRYAAFVGKLVGASSVMLVIKPDGGDNSWKAISQWEEQTGNSQQKALFRGQVPTSAEYCLQEGVFCRPLKKDADDNAAFVLAVSLPLQASRDRFVIISLLENVTEDRAKETLLRKLLITELPNQLVVRQQAGRASDDVRKISSVLDVVAQVSPEGAFIAGAMAMCNSLASKHQCERVSIGWVEGDGIRLRAISRTERFDRKMEAAQLLEAAMEECLDQHEVLVFPNQEERGPLTRDHEVYQKHEDLKFLCSLPISRGEEIVGVLTCERSGGAFTEAEIHQIQLTCELLGYRLADLKLKDRWIGSRLKDSIKDGAGRFIGPEHTWAKLISILMSVGLLALFLIHVPYRVEANFILKSEEAYYQSVPFDSYIEAVYKEAGDAVTAGEPVVKLDTDSLELEESSVLADLNRFRREAEKARASRQLADMQISEALEAQNQAQLELVRWRIEQATLRSPIDGLLVEGDLKERLGAPVREGEVLLRIARIDQLYVEADSDERDVGEILNATTGEIAFVSQPKMKFPVKVIRVEPSAVAKAGENVFLVRADFVDAPESWFRPGMSGVCKLDAGKRSLFWIFTHRTVDFFRMFFWW
ncbi:efflux RND transporter periplasmic adaptor subunit [Verrucomicrobia bacterium]|nr:efflux RND transporter periplasmic adaptor subunit [Verrucomicrobiota bacterium]MDA7866715.1 efflux RND transporter periplasmic adaptor subunit [Verrucomicrobiota bacterium]MDB4798638.1 efflux RND transporter periplasmic adaptor subunit [Verrucomicrobiota bacterium]